MNEYIFYTAEGYTFSPLEGEEVMNCQVLGRICGKNVTDAKNQLAKQFPWIKDCGFDLNEAICKQLVTDEIRTLLTQNQEDIKYLMNLLDREQRHKYDEWISNRSK